MSLTVLAPLSGRLVPLEEVPDPVFAGYLVGAGTALSLSDDDGALPALVQAQAPISGRLVKVFPHAFVVEEDGGRAVITHLGLDTLDAGSGAYEVLLAEGAEVSAGQAVIRWQPQETAAAGCSALVVVIGLQARCEDVEVTSAASVPEGGPLFTWF